MQFLNPAGAWAFLGMLPIIALYILRNKAKPAQVPSLLLWRRTQTNVKTARPFQRLKSRLLLWLRLLLAALMALILMRPAASGISGVERVFIFDLSASMQAEADGESRISEAKKCADEMLSDMGEGGKITVLCAGAEVEQPIVRSLDYTAARTVINGLKAQNGSADIDGAVSLALAMKRDMPNISVTVFSDSYKAANGSVSVEGIGKSCDNISISDLRLSEDDTRGYAYAKVSCFGASKNVTLECYTDGVLCDMRSVSIEANESASVRFETPSGVSSVLVRSTETDSLALDNERYAVNRKNGERTALLVTDGNIFLERALSLREGLSVYRTDSADVTGDYDMYIYDCTLPETLPDNGSVLAIAPSKEVLGIVPGKEIDAGTGLRLLSGDAARTVGQNLSLTDTALRTLKPLEGGSAAIACGGNAAISLAESDGRRAAVIGFDFHQSNLPIKADFPVLVQNLLGYLLPDVQAELGAADCGAPITMAVNDRAASVYVLSPSGKHIQLDGTTLSDTKEQGVYTLVELFDGDIDRETMFTVHMPGSEADTSITAATTDAEGVLFANGENFTEWTQWLLLAWLAVLMIEWGVSRRGVSR